jgi:C1A family cysteine protease
LENRFPLISRRAALSGLLAAAQPILLGPTLRSSVAQVPRAYGRGCIIPLDIGRRIAVQNAASIKLDQLIAGNPLLADAMKSVKNAAPDSSLRGHFDCREENRVTPVRDQGVCGSCWVFATLGGYESAYLKANRKIDYKTLEVNEQEMLDCNFPEANCIGGFHENAFIYLQNYGLIDSINSYKYNAAAPARGVYCNANFGKRPYYLSNWGYVSSSSLIPTDTEMKRAISAYGPVVSAVLAGQNWDGYDYKGVLKGTARNDPNKGSDHEVVIVGWDDKIQGDGLPPGAWIVKNSWSENWGREGGYVYVPYGRSNIGFTATWVTAWPNDSKIQSAVSDLAQMKQLK